MWRYYHHVRRRPGHHGLPWPQPRGNPGSVARARRRPFGGGAPAAAERRFGGARGAKILEDREGRLHLTCDIYLPPPDEPGLGRLEAALDKAVEGLAVEAKIRDAVRDGKIDRAPGNALVELALKAGAIAEADRVRLNDADEARDEAIQVDAFDPVSYRALVR